MKTLKQDTADRIEQSNREYEESQARIDRVLKDSIGMMIHAGNPLDDYDTRHAHRERVRDHLKYGWIALINLACDECGTELAQEHTSVRGHATIATVHCAGCGLTAKRVF